MAKIFGTFIFIIIGLCLTQVLSESPNESVLAEHNKKFALNFFNELLKDSQIKGKNFVYSPYSIQTAGALLYAGAGGKTANDMVTGFNLPDSDINVVGETFKNSLQKHSTKSPFKIANKIYIAKDFTVAPKFLDIATKDYDSDVESIAFEKKDESANTVNKWIENKTNGKIHDLVKPSYFDDNTRLVIANAIHFKGEWDPKFIKEATKLDDFYTTPNEKIQIELMHTDAKCKFGEIPELGIRLAEYPFKDSDISMFFLLPNSIEKSLDEVEAKLSDLILKENIFDKIQIMRKAHFTIPKFKIEHEIDLEKDLKSLGMSSLFDSTANFNNLLTSPQPIAVTKAIHKASIEVNEEGAEAAAATVIATGNRAGVLVFPFEIKQSFLYFIKGINGEIYFMGRFTGK